MVCLEEARDAGFYRSMKRPWFTAMSSTERWVLGCFSHGREGRGLHGVTAMLCGWLAQAGVVGIVLATCVSERLSADIGARRRRCRLGG